MGKVALITGVTGQDGAYLAELLLSKGYTTHGIKRRSSSFNTGRIDHLYQDPHEPDPRFVLHHGDMTDATNLIRIVQEVQPDEIYNLAAQSHVQVSFETPEYTANADGARDAAAARGDPHPRPRRQDAVLPGLDLRTLRHGAGGAAARNDALLSPQPLCGGQAVRLLDHGELPRSLRHARLERHPLQPREPDARRDLRHPQDHPRGRGHSPRAAGLPVSRQPRRPARLGPRPRLCRGDVADRCSRTRPTTTSWRPARPTRCASFVEKAFAETGRHIIWRGTGVDEVGLCGDSGRVHVKVDKRYYRPTEVDLLIGDPSKARERLGWQHRTSLDELVKEMVAADIEMLAARPQPAGAPWLTARLPVRFSLRGKRVWVAGHRGMVGSAIVRRAGARGLRDPDGRRATSSIFAGRPTSRPGWPGSGPRSCSSPPPGSAGSSPTTAGRRTSSTTT